MRARLLGRIADHLVARDPGHPLRVAVDGITAAGKTTFARDLAAAVEKRGRPAIHLSMDGFHHPRAHRHRQGRDSAAGYTPTRTTSRRSPGWCSTRWARVATGRTASGSSAWPPTRRSTRHP